MAEFSSIKTYGEIRAIDGILRRKSTAFEDKVFNDGWGNVNRSQASRPAGYYKYPYDLLTDPSHQSIMCIEIWDNNPQYLATKREAFARFGESLIDKMRTAQNAAEQDASADQKTDVVGMVANTLSAVVSGGGVILDTAKQVFADGNLKGQGLGRDSYTEEQTGLAGGTAPILQRIYLYMPTGLEVGYAMDYEDASMAGLDALKLPKAIGQTDDPAAARDIGKKIGMANLKVLDSLGELVGAEAGTFAKFASAQQRQVVNPMQLHLFKEVKRREFNFAYTFLPRNREEVETCHEIIGLLKFFSHPKRSEGSGRFLDYPAEFQIRFLTADGRENAYLPRILKCALKGVKVKYGEETTFTTFQNDGYGSAPTKITMELSFSELEILTRDRFGWELGNIPSP